MITPVRLHPGPTFWGRVKRNRSAYLFIAPFFTIFLLFMVFPIGFSAYLSLLEWNGIMRPRFVGLEHYGRALRDPGLHGALLNTMIFSVLTVVLATVVGLGLALFLNTVQILKRFFRGVFFIPSVVSLVVVALVWKLILNSEVGLLNEAIQGLGRQWGRLTGSVPGWTTYSHRFLDSPHRFVPLLTMTLVNVWGVVGFNTVIFLAGLQGIPANLYQVSRIDGATAWQDLRHITLPLLRPTTFFVVLITSIDALQVFVLPNVMNRGSGSTMTVVYYLFENAFEFYRMGYASAIAYILFALTVALSVAIRMTIGRSTRWVGAE